MQAVTSANAKDILDESAKSMREGFTPDSMESPDQPFPPETLPAGDSGTLPQERETPTPSPSDAATEKPGEEDLKSRHAKLEQDHRALEARFKSLQAAITPTQQERSELRKQVTALESELRELRTRTTRADSGQALPSQLEQPEFKAKIDAVREVMPEVADLLQATMTENQRLKGDVDQRLQAHDQRRHEETAQAVMTELFRQRPEAQRIAADPAFWSWIDAQGPEAPYYRSILKEPWKQDLGATFAILDAFTALREPPPVQPPVQAPPTPRPTDMAVPTRMTTRPGTQSGPQFLTDSQIKEAEVRIRKGGPRAALDLASQLRESMRTQAKR